jgi:hypothetical protein
MALTERSKRQSFLGADSDNTFAGATVAIVGLCGGGSHIAPQLAHIGIEQFRIFDPDHVDHSNLNRMLGSKPGDADAKRLKTDVIREQILSIRPSAKVEPIPKKWQQEHSLLRGCTAVFGCVDSFEQRSQLEAYCRRLLIPYIDIGMDVEKRREDHFNITGQVILSLPDHPCMWCMRFLNRQRMAEEAAQYGDAGDRPQVVWPNGVLASTAVGMFVGLLTPWRVPQDLVLFVEYDGNRHELRPSNVLSLAHSKPCTHFMPTDRGDPVW